MSDVVEHSPRAVLDRELAEIRELALEMGEAVERAITRAVGGLLQGDPGLCDEVVAGDAELNALQLRLRELVQVTILTQAPVDGDLRRLLAHLHMSSELERMGDHCVSIAKIARERTADTAADGLDDEMVLACANADDTPSRALGLTMIAHHLERIADRVTTMGEDLLFLEAGIVEELG